MASYEVLENMVQKIFQTVNLYCVPKTNLDVLIYSSIPAYPWEFFTAVSVWAQVERQVVVTLAYKYIIHDERSFLHLLENKTKRIQWKARGRHKGGIQVEQTT